MATAANLLVRCGEDWTATMTFKRNGVASRVVDPIAQVRSAKTHAGELVLTMDEAGGIITQDDDGVLVFLIPSATTAALAAGTYYWDLFGTVDGKRIKLADVGKFVVHASVSY